MIVEFPNPDSLAECLIADELSRLREEVKALRAERGALLQQIVADYPPIEAELEEVSDRAFKAEAERDALRADAERYRWLRDPKNAYHDAWNYFSPSGSAAEMDAVIDAAMKGGGND